MIQTFGVLTASPQMYWPKFLSASVTFEMIQEFTKKWDLFDLIDFHHLNMHHPEFRITILFIKTWFERFEPDTEMPEGLDIRLDTNSLIDDKKAILERAPHDLRTELIVFFGKKDIELACHRLV